MKIRQRYVGPEGADQDRYWMRRALAQARLAEGARIAALVVVVRGTRAERERRERGRRLSAGGSAPFRAWIVCFAPNVCVRLAGAAIAV